MRVQNIYITKRHHRIIWLASASLFCMERIDAKRAKRYTDKHSDDLQTIMKAVMTQ